MRFPILLLDCSKNLEKRLLKLGFDIETGTVGYCTGKRSLPSQVYEKDIIIYNPSNVIKNDKDDYVTPVEIDNLTPEYKLSDTVAFLQRGGIVLAIVKKVADEWQTQNQAYNWIPLAPSLDPTKDSLVVPARIKGTYLDFLIPVVSKYLVKTPVGERIIEAQPRNIAIRLASPLYFNIKSDILGYYYENFNSGKVILLPENQSNDDVIVTFLKRVIPKLLEVQPQTNLVDTYKSPQELGAEKKVQTAEEKLEEHNKKLTESQDELNQAKVNKVSVIKKDETAVLILNYFDVAIDQEEISLFYLYKITEALQKKYGSEKEAKSKIGCNSEWKYIRKLANTSYADIRHAPSPGEKIKDWTEEEIKEAYSKSTKIIHSYLNTLF